MRAYIEPDDDDTPIMSVLVMEGGNITDGYFKATYPLKWHIEIDEVPT